jgi:hypothetical protein
LHHYIPRCYLKGFTRGKENRSQLFAVDLVERRAFWTSPRNVCAVRDFNRVELPGHPPDALEIALSKFDGELGAALKTIQHDRSFTDPEAKLILLNFASVVATRNPEMRARMEDFARRLMEIATDIVVATPERYESQMRRMRKDGALPEGAADIPYEEMREFIQGRKYEIEFPPGYHVTTEFDAQDTVLRTMVARKWALLRAPVDAEFITSDLPACLWPNRPTRHPMGFGMSETTVLLPVTASLLALGTFDGPEGAFDIPREHVASLNLAVAMKCDRLVLARSDKFETSDEKGTLTVGAKLADRVMPSRRYSRAAP